MKCSRGDLAFILYSIRPENIGRIVRVKEYIGSFEQGETFQFRGMPCKCAVSDHYWWIGADDITVMYGPAPRAYIPDSWLEPIRSNQGQLNLKQDIDVKEKVETFE